RSGWYRSTHSTRHSRSVTSSSIAGLAATRSFRKATCGSGSSRRDAMSRRATETLAELAHRLHQTGVDVARVSPVPARIRGGVRLLLHRLVQPPQVAPRIDETRDPDAAIERRRRGDDLAAARDGSVEDRLRVVDVD